MNLQLDEYLLTTIFKICTQISDSESLQFGKFIFKTLPVIYKNHTIVLSESMENVPLYTKPFQNYGRASVMWGVGLSCTLYPRPHPHTPKFIFRPRN